MGKTKAREEIGLDPGHPESQSQSWAEPGLFTSTIAYLLLSCTRFKHPSAPDPLGYRRVYEHGDLSQIILGSFQISVSGCIRCLFLLGLNFHIYTVRVLLFSMLEFCCETNTHAELPSMECPEQYETRTIPSTCKIFLE